MAGDEALWIEGSGDRASQAHRRGDVALRRSGPWSATTQALLRHFEAVGFTGAPKVVGDGFADDGRETLSFVAGESPHPGPSSDEGIVEVGRLLRAVHDATASFVPRPDARWRPWFGRALEGSEPVISHNDPGPWNIVARHGRPVALVDWEFAGPVDARWDLAHTAWLNARLHDDDLAQRHALGRPGAPGPTARAAPRRLRRLVSSRRRHGLVDTMIASWMLRNRDLLQRSVDTGR